jgi:hypothetical protein
METNINFALDDPQSIRFAKQSSLAKNMLQDQVSALNPYAVLVVNPMLQEVGFIIPVICL